VVVRSAVDVAAHASARRSRLLVPASTREKLLGALVVIAALVYLIPFVPRGWVTHDEGMLGQSAERVLHGGIPHIDYEEMYTGGLSWLYAAVFKVTGVDLIHIRWTLFIGACVALWLVYAITRRYLRPIGAALAAWVALVWSFPNYFAGLPSWWLLICALVCLWTWIRYVETLQWRYVAIAGLAAGAAIAIKQTGLYLFVALVLAILFNGGRIGAFAQFAAGLDGDGSTPGAAAPSTPALEQLGRWAAAVATVMFAFVILGRRIFGAEGLYLLAPALACAAALVFSQRASRSAGWHSPFGLVAVAAVAAALPLAVVVIPYLVRHQLWELVYGAVVLPQKRLALAKQPMLTVIMSLILAGPLLWLVYVEFRTRKMPRSAAMTVLTWTAAVLLPVHALWSMRSYQVIWHFARTAAAILPVAIASQLVAGRISDPGRRAVLFMAAAILAWTSFNQFPFAGPIYFCYSAPLVLIAAVAAINAEPTVRSDAMRPWTVFLLMFGVLSLNRGYLDGLGGEHIPVRLDTPLALPKAHLNVSNEDADMYQAILSRISEHRHGGELVAGPDCPEVYFLAGVTNSSGRLYDFLSGNVSDDADAWVKAEVVVVNHAPPFSPAPSQGVLTVLRREFAHGEQHGSFEIRWR
jgi:dolichyl-phosphate-mannose-protein mannosyltransferase